MAMFDDLARIPSSRKIAIVVVIFALVGVGYYFVRYQSLATEREQADSRHSQLETEERDLLTKRENYVSDVRRLAQLRENFAAQTRILPPSTEISAFLESLNNHAELAGLEILMVQPMDEEGVGFYAKIPVELHLRGRYHELAKFFYNVGRLERIINIENISLDPDTTSTASTEVAEESEVILQAKVLATTFRAIEEENADEATDAQ